MLNWLLGKPKFRFYEDSFARTRSGLLDGVRNILEERIQRGESFLIVTHFPVAFVEIQEKLADWYIDYRINSSPQDPFAAGRMLQDDGVNVVLSLASLLQTTESADDAFDDEQKVCVMVLERHPQAQHDLQLERFCRSIACYVEVGYFMSFEDAVVAELINPSILRILDMFGMGENELVTSNMVSRRLKSVLRHNSRFYTTDHATDSARQWLELNKKSNDES